MSNLINDGIKEEIMEEILEMADKDIWNVIFAIGNEFGIDNLPDPALGNEGMINRLFELRFEARLV
ncbi:MAG: hypothetical protein EBW42_08035 [Rhodobacterales bacterium]|nr:hypothetical protein [Rhodobacterales bacterium]